MSQKCNNSVSFWMAFCIGICHLKYINSYLDESIWVIFFSHNYFQEMFYNNLWGSNGIKKTPLCCIRHSFEVQLRKSNACRNRLEISGTLLNVTDCSGTLWYIRLLLLNPTETRPKYFYSVLRLCSHAFQPKKAILVFSTQSGIPPSFKRPFQKAGLCRLCELGTHWWWNRCWWKFYHCKAGTKESSKPWVTLTGVCINLCMVALF